MTLQVPFYDFNNLHHEEFRKQIKERIGKIIDDGSFVEGPYNKEFEKQFAQNQKAKHCLLVANGTDALEIALKVSGVHPGDRVGVPGITFYATAEAVLNIGATPVFVDVEPTTGLISLESLKRVHSNYKLKAVIPVHIYGLPCDMAPLLEFTQEEEIRVIEDAAQAQGAFYSEGGPVGSLDTLCTFSFYPTKNLSAFGDAGCILTQSDELAELIVVERNHGRGHEQRMGRNSRCDHIQAAVLELKMKEIEKFNNKRKDIAGQYQEALKELPIEIPEEKYNCLSSWHLYPVRLENSAVRERLAGFLKDKGIATAPFYERALSQEGALAGFEGEDEEAKNLAGRVLCLPMNPFLSYEQVQYVKEMIGTFFNS